MKIRFVHVGLVVAAALMAGIWMSAKMRQAHTARILADPVPVAASDATDATGQRSREDFQRMARQFLRDAPNMSPEIRMERARALAREVGTREQSGELTGEEAVMIRIGLIQSAVVDDTERVRQAQAVVDHYREQSAQRQAALAARVQQDARQRAYKAREAEIVAEVLAMSSYPGGLSRDDYLRLRLREAHHAIYGAARPSTTP